MKNTDWFERLKETASGNGWSVTNESADGRLRAGFATCLSRDVTFRFTLEVGDGCLRCVANSLLAYIDALDVNPAFVALEGVQRTIVVKRTARLWNSFRNAADGAGEEGGAPAARRVRVHLSVDLTVVVRDGHPALTAEDVESVLADMDYSFTPSDEHAESGVAFDGRGTEITDWEYSV